MKRSMLDNYHDSHFYKILDMKRITTFHTSEWKRITQANHTLVYLFYYKDKIQQNYNKKQ